MRPAQCPARGRTPAQGSVAAQYRRHGTDIRVPQEDYGKFYSGDSYIVLKTTVPPRGRKQWDLFFWLGQETTADESGIAAYKTVELGARAAPWPVLSAVAAP